MTKWQFGKLLLCKTAVKRGRLRVTTLSIQVLTAVKQAQFNLLTKISRRTVVVTQLAERSLPIPEVHGSNPDTGFFIEHLFTVNRIVLKRRK